MRLEVGEVKTGGKNRGKQNHGQPMGIPLDDPGIGPVGPSDLADQPCGPTTTDWFCLFFWCPILNQVDGMGSMFPT